MSKKSLISFEVQSMARENRDADRCEKMLEPRPRGRSQTKVTRYYRNNVKQGKKSGAESESENEGSNGGNKRRNQWSKLSVGARRTARVCTPRGKR